MAIEIIARGSLPENDVFDVTCRRCRSQLRFLRSDAKLTSDQRDGDFLSITCPVCRDSITTAANRSPRPLS